MNSLDHSITFRLVGLNMKYCMGLSFSLLFSLTAVSASAQASDPPITDAPRFRFGIDLAGGLAVMTGFTNYDPPLGAGLNVRLGVQLNDKLAVFNQASLLTLVVDGWVRESVRFEYTPRDWFSIAVGPSVEYSGWAGGDDYLLVAPARDWRFALTCFAQPPRATPSSSISICCSGYVMDRTSRGQGFTAGAVIGIGYELF